MKNTLALLCVFIICAVVIIFAVKAGMHHDNCNECRLGYKDSSLVKR